MSHVIAAVEGTEVLQQLYFSAPLPIPPVVSDLSAVGYYDGFYVASLKRKMEQYSYKGTGPLETRERTVHHGEVIEWYVTTVLWESEYDSAGIPMESNFGATYDSEKRARAYAAWMNSRLDEKGFALEHKVK